MNERKSNMELLRIFSMILIITFHYAYKGGFDFGTEISANMFLIKICWMFGELGVNLFILTTGYFMVEGRVKWKKLILLLVEVSFYHWLTIGIACKLGIYELSGLKNIFLTFFPVLLNRYWFITAYIIIYIFSPYLNMLAHEMLRRGDAYKKFLITLLLLYSVIPTVFGTFFNTTETLLYYNRLIWLTVVYFLGAYIRLQGISAIQTTSKAAKLSVIAFGVLLLSIFLIQKFSSIFTRIGIKEAAYFWPPNTLPMVCLSVGVFGLFLNMPLTYHPGINKIASTTLGIYLLHDGVLNRWLWRTVFQNATHQNSPLLFLHIFSTVAIIFAFGVIIDLVRQVIERHTEQRLLGSQVLVHAVTKVKSVESGEKKGREGSQVKREKENVLKWAVGVIFACSFALLSFYQIIKYDSRIIYATIILSFFCGLLFYVKTVKESTTYLKNHPQIAIALLIVAIALIYAMYQVKGIPNKATPFPPLSLRLFRLRYWIIAAPALFYLLTWLARKLGGFIHRLWQNMDPEDRKIYFWGSVIFSCIVIISYVIEPKWYLQYDRVYSIDSGWVYKNLYPQLSYYDIRHPILSIITFPIWALVHSLLCLVVPQHLLNVLCVICVQLINVQLLLLVGMMIKELTKSRWTFLLYLASFPVLTFTMFFEKYQICVFLLVLYAYLICKKEKGTEISLILATGTMPTSILLFGNELLIKEPIVQKAKRIFRMAACGVMTLVCTGRIHLLVPQILLSETVAKAQRFGLKNLPIEECMASFVNMVHGAFLPLSTQSGKRYLWVNITQSVSFIGCAILAMIIIGLIWARKDEFAKLCGIWLTAGIVLFCVFQWGVGESPLFSIYFVWALIPLFQKGIQFAVEKMRWKETVIYPIIIVSMLAINILAIIDIGKFLRTFSIG